eukprot:5729319-Amphidinium_carterae.1
MNTELFQCKLGQRPTAACAKIMRLTVRSSEEQQFRPVRKRMTLYLQDLHGLMSFNRCHCNRKYDSSKKHLGLVLVYCHRKM